MYNYFSKNFFLKIKKQNYYFPIHILVILLFTIIYKLISEKEHEEGYETANKIVGRTALNKESWEEILYFSVITHFTVGFGDIVPETKLMRRATICHILIAFSLFNL